MTTKNTASRTHEDKFLESPLTGNALLECPLLNKGTAFSEEERDELGLLGLLPPHIESLAQQVSRAYEAYQRKTADLEKHIYLRNLQDTNETLFYRLLLDHLTEMMPIIYTPVVGAACQQFSEIYRRPRGLFISYAERDAIDVMLDNALQQNVEVIVVTDGERILGLGDQGAGGLGIPIGKLSLYTACGAIDPSTTLPIVLDVGTNNEERLKDPLYIGWRHERIKGQAYYDFVDRFVQAVKRKWPHMLLQFEDFAQTHASPLLERYRDELCTFNDDIQGTAAVTAGTLLAAGKVTGTRFCEQTVAFLGAGSAGCGIAEQLIKVMINEGLSETEARARFFMVDRPGLLHDGLDGLLPFQEKLAQPKDRVSAWGSNKIQGITLMDVVNNAKPTVLVGVSGQPGLFTEKIVRKMASHTERPIIFPLSNPTSRVEATPSDLIAWTEGKALVTTGSPFDPVKYNGVTFPIAQCNNSYIFPGMGLGILAAGARRVSDEMFMAASVALSESSPATHDPNASLLPPLSTVREVSTKIASAVATQAQAQGLANETTPQELQKRINAKRWDPCYGRLKRAK
ncbi:MAG: NAD-dependent malic enzyme [Gammaproteobacteria bacterium]